MPWCFCSMIQKKSWFFQVSQYFQGLHDYINDVWHGNKETWVQMYAYKHKITMVTHFWDLRVLKHLTCFTKLSSIPFTTITLFYPLRLTTNSTILATATGADLCRYRHRSKLISAHLNMTVVKGVGKEPDNHSNQFCFYENEAQYWAILKERLKVF